MDVRLNRQLLKKQNIDSETEKQLLETHKKLYEIKQNPEEYSDVLELVTDLEYSLQELWGFKKDKKYHIHQFEIKTCTCPWMDNLERAGSGMFIYNQQCPIHNKLKDV